MKALLLLLLPPCACLADGELHYPFSAEPVLMQRSGSNWTFTVTNLSYGRDYSLWRKPVNSTNWFKTASHLAEPNEAAVTFTNRHEPKAAGYLFQGRSLELLKMVPVKGLAPPRLSDSESEPSAIRAKPHRQ